MRLMLLKDGDKEVIIRQKDTLIVLYAVGVSFCKTKFVVKNVFTNKNSLYFLLTHGIIYMNEEGGGAVCIELQLKNY